MLVFSRNSLLYLPVISGFRLVWHRNLVWFLEVESGATISSWWLRYTPIYPQIVNWTISSPMLGGKKSTKSVEKRPSLLYVLWWTSFSTIPVAWSYSWPPLHPFVCFLHIGLEGKGMEEEDCERSSASNRSWTELEWCIIPTRMWWVYTHHILVGIIKSRATVWISNPFLSSTWSKRTFCWPSTMKPTTSTGTVLITLFWTISTLSEKLFCRISRSRQQLNNLSPSRPWWSFQKLWETQNA